MLLLAAATVSPAAAQIPTKIYAQQLVDETAARNPDVLVVAMHLTPPKSSDNVIIASNIGRIGEKADQEILAVTQSGQAKTDITESGTRFDVELSLSDTAGANVGALELVFPNPAAGGQTQVRKRAETIRDALSRRILNQANLFDPYPLDPSVTTKTYAQKLVDAAMTKHPELLSLAMHVTLPNGRDNIILGSSFGRIGKKADEDDMKVIETGEAIPGIYAAGKRYGLELVLQDAPGKTIGALSVAYPYRAGEDQLALRSRAEKLRDELRRQIDSAEQLVQLDP